MDPGERGRTFALGLEELRRLAFDPFILERWLGVRVDDRPRGTAGVTDAVGTVWPGFVRVPSSGGMLCVCLGSPGPDRGLAPADFRVTVSTAEAGRSCVRVTADDPSDCRLDLLWEPALGRLDALVTSELRRRDEPAQAVVIIHGIGEQRPGQTLEAFVRAVTREATGQRWSSQDRLAPTLELRRLTLSQVASRPRTTFYEYYWAHEVNDTNIGDVLSWVWSIMGRSPTSIPRRLLATWFVFWGLVVAGLSTTASIGASLESLAFLSGVASAVLGVVATQVIRVLGDAARYLSARPRNVAIRHAIRQGGIELLRELHRCGRYDRIVLVGHSLGSVVAYDIITHLWPTMNREHLRPEKPRFTELAAAHALASDRTAGSVQNAVWREMRRNTLPWLVSDLVTLGSPLAHAHLLLEHDAEAFSDKQSQGAYPSAPPTRKNRGDRFSFNQTYTTRGGRSGSFTFLDESAPFAAVRWHNLYFPAPGGIFGDLVGGPLAPVFGEWVADVAVTSEDSWWRRRTLLAHTSYWRVPRRKAAGPGPHDHLRALADALQLDQRQRLQTELAKHDPLIHVERP